MSETIAVAGIPFPLVPSESSSWAWDAESHSLSVTAEPRSDIFVDPAAGDDGAAATLNAVTLLADAPSGDFQLSTRVRVGFAATFDAGVLLLWLDEKHWAKLCFEFSPDAEPMIVSVVCRDVADDANAFVVAGNDVWLRVSRMGRVYAYHASSDGDRWRMVRAFALDAPGTTARIGFEAQSPMGEGCDVMFSEIAFASSTLRDMRDGS